MMQSKVLQLLFLCLNNLQLQNYDFNWRKYYENTVWGLMLLRLGITFFSMNDTVCQITDSL